MKHPNSPHAGSTRALDASATRVVPTTGQIAEVELQIAGLRDQANRAGDMITGLALIRDGIDRHPWFTSLPEPEDAGTPEPGRQIQYGLHVLLTAWGGKLQAERAYLDRLADANEHNLKLAQSGLVIPQ